MKESKEEQDKQCNGELDKIKITGQVRCQVCSFKIQLDYQINVQYSVTKKAREKEIPKSNGDFDIS